MNSIENEQIKFYFQHEAADQGVGWPGDRSHQVRGSILPQSQGRSRRAAH